MACPICGAKCVCKKQGPGGICCDCHRHKVNGARLERGSPEMDTWRQQHGYGDGVAIEAPPPPTPVDPLDPPKPRLVKKLRAYKRPVRGRPVSFLTSVYANNGSCRNCGAPAKGFTCPGAIPACCDICVRDPGSCKCAFAEQQAQLAKEIPVDKTTTGGLE